MQIWDTAGQERYQTITQTYYSKAIGIILAYSVTDRKSFQNVKMWMKQIKENCEESICIVLVGNKCDVSEDDGRVVSETEGREMAG